MGHRPALRPFRRERKSVGHHERSAYGTSMGHGPFDTPWNEREATTVAAWIAGDCVGVSKGGASRSSRVVSPHRGRAVPWLTDATLGRPPAARGYAVDYAVHGRGVRRG